MGITISPRAVQQLQTIRQRDANDALALRVMVESGGCHGFQYKLKLTDAFDEKEDTVFDVDGSKVVVDEMSLELLNGSKIDFTQELIGSEFKVVDNPFATSSCGCEVSFAIDLDKLPARS